MAIPSWPRQPLVRFAIACLRLPGISFSSVATLVGFDRQLLPGLLPFRPAALAHGTRYGVAVLLAMYAPLTHYTKGFRTAIILVGWEIWKERNDRMLNNKSSMPMVLNQKSKMKGLDSSQR